MTLLDKEARVASRLVTAYQPLGKIHLSHLQHTPKLQNNGVVLPVDGAVEGPTSEHKRCHSKRSRNFDVADKTRSHVLKFDAKGTSTILKMSRSEILHMTTEASKGVRVGHSSSLETQDPTASPSSSPPPLGPQRKSAQRLATRRESYTWRNDRPLTCSVQSVHARDIRRLDNTFAFSNEPSIIIRKQAILFNAGILAHPSSPILCRYRPSCDILKSRFLCVKDPIRAVIMRDTCLVFMPDGDDHHLQSLTTERFIESMNEDDDAAFEFRALEALLATLSRYFEMDFEKSAPIVTATLDKMAKGRISTSQLETIRLFKNSMHEFESQVDGVRRCLMEKLDNEEDLRLLHLTKLYEDPSLMEDLFSFDAEIAEVLIENYMQEIFSTHTKVHLMLHRIQSTESLVMLKLDSARNYMLSVELVFSLVGIALAIGTYITGAFGMNLDSGVQQLPHWFWAVVAATLFIANTIVLVGITFFRSKGIFLQ